MTTHLYLGSAEGIHALVSEDGELWEAKPSRMPAWAVEEIALVADKPHIVIVGTRGDGVWVSEDFGETFTKPCRGSRGPGKVRCVTVDPHNSNRIYAGCEPIDVFVSEDLGASWSTLDSIREHEWIATIDYPVPTVEPHVRDITIDPKNPGTIFVALQVGAIFKTTDGGKSWKLLKEGLDTDVHTIVIDPDDTSHMVIATGGHDARLENSPGRALYVSDNAGESWSPTGLNFYQEYSVPLVPQPGQPAVLYSALANNNPSRWRRETGAEGVLIRSLDGGLQWDAVDTSAIGGFDRSYTYAVTIDPSNVANAYGVMSNGDLIRSRDGGDSWSLLGINQPGVSDIKVVSV